MNVEREIISESFRVHFMTGMSSLAGFRDFKKEGTTEYIWRTDPAGTLYVYNKEYHKTFTTAVIKDQRVAAYPRGQWAWVEVLETTTDDAPVRKGIEQEDGSLLFTDKAS